MVIFARDAALGGVRKVVGETAVEVLSAARIASDVIRGWRTRRRRRDRRQAPEGSEAAYEPG